MRHLIYTTMVGLFLYSAYPVAARAQNSPGVNSQVLPDGQSSESPALAGNPADNPQSSADRQTTKDTQSQKDPQAEQVTPSETAKNQSTVRVILTNFWRDQNAIWKSPLHPNHDNAKWWALFGIGTMALIATDRTTERAIPFSVTQTSYSTNVSQIGQEYVTLPIAAGLYFYGRTKNDPKAREVGVLGAEAMLDAEIVVSVLKVVGGRERPNQVGGNGRFFKGHGLNSGFPSGHAIETWSFASIISHEYTKGRVVPIIAYGLATAVSISRFTGQYHYPSDIVAGGAMGWFIGKYVWDHHRDPEIHKRDLGIGRLMPKTISPVMAPGSKTYGVAMAWGK